MPIVIGYNSNDIIDISNKNSLYIKGGISTSNLTIRNDSNSSISLRVPETLKSNIAYYLPEIPKTISRLMMTTDSNGFMKWTETNIFTTDTNITLGSIITSNIYVSGIISGDGSKLSNLNLSDRTTDDLKEGKNNLYFTIPRTSNIIKKLISEITTDFIKEGYSNIYYTKDRDSNAFKLNFSNITTDNIKEGSNNLYFNQNYLSNAIIFNFTKITTDDIKEGTSNLFLTSSNINKLISNKTTDDIKEGSSNLFYTNQRANSNLNYFIKSITTDDIKEGSSNLFYSIERMILLKVIIIFL